MQRSFESLLMMSLQQKKASGKVNETYSTDPRRRKRPAASFLSLPLPSSQSNAAAVDRTGEESTPFETSR